MSVGMGVLDKYNASYSNATPQRIQALSSVRQSVRQLFTSHMASTPGTVIVLAGMVVLDKFNASYSNATHQKIQPPRRPQDALGSRGTPCGLDGPIRLHMVPYGSHMVHMVPYGPICMCPYMVPYGLRKPRDAMWPRWTH